MENRLLARGFLILAIGAFISLLIFIPLFLFSQGKTTHTIIFIFGSILLIISVIAFFTSRSYTKRENDK
jgi:Na+/melibiose symporter-like transporter